MDIFTESLDVFMFTVITGMFFSIWLFYISGTIKRSEGRDGKKVWSEYWSGV